MGRLLSWGSTMSERDVFTAARQITDPAARSAYLDEACHGDPALRDRVEALLRAHGQPDSLLDAPAAALPDPGLAATRSHGAPGAEPAGRPTRPRREGARLPTVPRPAWPTRLTRPDWALRGARGARPRRVRDGLAGVRRGAATCRGGEGTGLPASRHLAGPEAVPPRGPVVRS